MSLTLRPRVPAAVRPRRAPRIADLLCIAVAGAIFLLPLNSSARGCDEGSACIESSLTQTGPSSGVVATTTDDGGLLSMDVSMMVLALAAGIVLYTFIVMYRREAEPT